MKLSVVIPAYNEEENIEKVILDIVVSFGNETEIVVVNDASTDNTIGVLVELSKKYHQLVVYSNETNRGHGYSVMKGLKEAQGDYILYIDADRQIDLDNIRKIDGEQVDWVSGKREHRKDKLFRKVISFCLRYTILCRHFMYVRDSNCPFKLYRAEILKPLLDKVPRTNIVPIACLEVIARKHKVNTLVIPTPHHPYEGLRKGFLQSFNIKMYIFLWNAFWEVVKL